MSLQTKLLIGALAALAPLYGTSSTTPNARISWNHPPNSLSVSAKQSLTITFDRAATWTLQAGSKGSISVHGNTVTFSAPPVKAQNAVAGCQVLPADTVYTTPIDNLPVDARSAAWIAHAMGVGPVALGFGEAWGHNIVDNSLPPIAMQFLYTTLRNGAKYQILSGNNRNRETGSITTDGGNDHHMITINRETCRIFETYHDYETGLDTGSRYTANSGYDYASSTYDQPISAEGGGTTDAAGLPLLPLTVHLSEWEAGTINHALRFTSCRGCIASPALWPAVGSTAATPGAAPMGSRWRLKRSFNRSAFSPKAQVILTALQRYGMLLADIGSMQQVQVDDDINLDPKLNAALGEIQQAHIVQSSFEIVDESSFITLVSSSRVNAANGFVTPPNFVVLNGVDSKGKKLSIPISVQPVLVGTPSETLFVQAGTPYQLKSWVNNAADQNVMWALTSGPGAVNSSGLYTPPASVTAPVAYTLTATSVADPTASVSVRGFVLPAGAIRIDVGNLNPYTDSHGNVWLGDSLGVYTGSYHNDNQTYPGSKWGKLADWFLYGWDKYTWGDDIVYGPFAVPNGAYKIEYLFAKGDCSGKFSPSFKFDNGLVTGGVLGLEANGVMTPFNFGQAVGNSCLTPATGSIATTVTNNLLTLAVRATGSEGAHQAPFLNALAITRK